MKFIIKRVQNHPSLKRKLLKSVPASNQINWIYLIPLALISVYLLMRSRTFENFALGYFFSVLVLSPVVHSWYFSWLVPFAIPTQNLGVRLISLSSFIYFVLQYNLALGGTEWKLSHFERLFLWTPLLFGYFWSSVNSNSANKKQLL